MGNKLNRELPENNQTDSKLFLIITTASGDFPRICTCFYRIMRL